VSGPRIAAIGIDFGDDRVDEFGFDSSHTLVDRDVVFLRPEGVEFGYRADWRESEYRGARMISQDDSPRIDADVARRRKELDALLQRGGTLVLFLPAPGHWYVYTGKQTTSGTGRNQKVVHHVEDRQLNSLLPFSLTAEKGSSRDFEIVGGDPFASFWRSIDGMEAAAYLTSDFGHAVMKIKGTDFVVAAIARIGAGSVILLPQDRLFYGDEDEDEDDGEVDEEEFFDSDSEEEADYYSAATTKARFLDALLELVREVRVEEGEFAQPEWAQGWAFESEAESLGAVAVAEAHAAEAVSAAAELNAELAKLQRRKVLFTGSGKALELVVTKAFEALGFDVEEGLPGRTDRIMRHTSLGAAVVEIKGKGKTAAEKDSAQLEKWVASHKADHDEVAKPILVINGWRRVSLDQRDTTVFPEQMLPYAEARSHCLVSGIQLLCAWLDAEKHPERRDEIARALIDCVGVFDRYANWEEWLTPRKVEEVIEDEA
jgi:hypothetical protein